MEHKSDPIIPVPQTFQWLLLSFRRESSLLSQQPSSLRITGLLRASLTPPFTAVLFPSSLHSGPGTHQSYSHLRVFLLNTPSADKTLSPYFRTTHPLISLSLCLNVTISQRSFPATTCEMVLPSPGIFYL